MFDSVTVLSTDEANLNEEDITDMVQFHVLPPKGSHVVGDTLDYIYAHFEPRSVNNAGIIIELQGDHVVVHESKPDDHLLINTETGDFSEVFSHRENSSITVIPINSGEEYTTINTAYVDWYRNFDIRYIAVASLSYSGFNVYEIPFVKATHSTNGDVLDSLLNKDYLYVILDSASLISLRFNTADLQNPDPTLLREYIFETNGRYVKGGPDGQFTHSLNVRNSRNPYNYKLYINYPNPFNPKTMIKYDIAKAGLVRLKVYDLLGRLVTTLVNDYRNPGNYNVTFDGTNLASGVYIYKLEAGNFIDVKKMVLIK